MGSHNRSAWHLGCFLFFLQCSLCPQGVHLIYRHVKITWLLCIAHSSNINKIQFSASLYFPISKKSSRGKIDSSIITLKVESTRKGLARWSSIINRWQIFATYLPSPFFQEIYSSAFQEGEGTSACWQINHQIQYLASLHLVLKSGQKLKIAKTKTFWYSKLFEIQRKSLIL